MNMPASFLPTCLQLLVEVQQAEPGACLELTASPAGQAGEPLTITLALDAAIEVAGGGGDTEGETARKRPGQISELRPPSPLPLTWWGYRACVPPPYTHP